MRDVDKSGAQILTQFLQLSGACCAVRAGQVSMRQKNDYDDRSKGERHQSKCERPEMRPDLETE